MADTRVLLNGLVEYRVSLDRHLRELQAEYDELDIRWNAFSVVYEGDAADQYKDGWARTESRFRDYLHYTKQIAALLDARIEALRLANVQEGMQLG